MRMPTIQIDWDAIFVEAVKAQHLAVETFNSVAFFITCYIFWCLAFEFGSRIVG